MQFLAAKDGLETEAIERARILDYDGAPVPVMAPEYLAVIYVLAGGGKRRDRTRALFEAGAIDGSTLTEILQRHGLAGMWKQKWGYDNE